jgi:hypothetical protein
MDSQSVVMNTILTSATWKMVSTLNTQAEPISYLEHNVNISCVTINRTLLGYSLVKLCRVIPAFKFYLDSKIGC